MDGRLAPFGSITVVGILFVSLGAAGLTLALSWAELSGWTSTTILGLSVGSNVALRVFVVVESRITGRILP